MLLLLAPFHLMLLQWGRTREVFIISFKGPFLIFQLGIIEALHTLVACVILCRTSQHRTRFTTVQRPVKLITQG